ncbi:MAG: hypothetical protein AAFQ15_11635 [Pseudomonadota bacterium]
MKARLLRALQRGGVAASSGGDTWRVWRSQDRRGRIIGTLSGAEIDILRLRNDLKPLGCGEEQLLVWAGERVGRDRDTSTAPDFALVSDQYKRSLLEMLIANCPSQALRTQIRKACQSYLHDLEDVSRGSSTTMNWHGLARGRLDKGQRQRSDFEPRTGKPAERRLGKVAEEVSRADQAFLRQLVETEASRASIARTFAMRPALAEQKGMSILRKLVAAYGV